MLEQDFLAWLICRYPSGPLNVQSNVVLSAAKAPEASPSRVAAATMMVLGILAVWGTISRLDEQDHLQTKILPRWKERASLKAPHCSEILDPGTQVCVT